MDLNNANKVLEKYENGTNLSEEIQMKLKYAEEKLEKVQRDHHVETSALLNKIARLESQLSTPVTDELYEKMKGMHEKNSFYSEICEEMCKTLKIPTSSIPDLPAKVKELANYCQISKKSEEILQKICEDLNVGHTEVLEKVKNIWKNQYKLYEKLADLLVQCSPKGKFNGLPGCHHVWKWVTKVLEDYMMLKKKYEVTL